MTLDNGLTLITIVMSAAGILIGIGRLMSTIQRLGADVRELSRTIERLEERLHKHDTRLAVLEAARNSQ